MGILLNNSNLQPYSVTLSFVETKFKQIKSVKLSLNVNFKSDKNERDYNIKLIANIT